LALFTDACQQKIFRAIKVTDGVIRNMEKLVNLPAGLMLDSVTAH